MPILGVIDSQKSGKLSAASFDSIATFTGNGTTGTATFSSIPSTYAHLQIRCLMYGSASAVQMRFNNDATGLYTGHKGYFYGSGPTNIGYTYMGNNTIGNAWNEAYALNTTQGAYADLQIEDYANTSKWKTYKLYYGLTTTSGTSSESDFVMGTYRNTTAINRIDIIANSGTFAADTTIALYGIKA
jgi:hypothetical protein